MHLNISQIYRKIAIWNTTCFQTLSLRMQRRILEALKPCSIVSRAHAYAGPVFTGFWLPRGTASLLRLSVFCGLLALGPQSGVHHNVRPLPFFSRPRFPVPFARSIDNLLLRLLSCRARAPTGLELAITSSKTLRMKSSESSCMLVRFLLYTFSKSNWC